jgi:hypothetical protein
MDATDGFAHTGDVPSKVNEGEMRKHVESVDCWCQPVRHRYNSLMRQWEVWDRDNFRWVYLEPQPEAPLDAATAQAVKDESKASLQTERVVTTHDTVAPPAQFDVTEMEGRDADREAGRVEDHIKRSW